MVDATQTDDLLGTESGDAPHRRRKNATRKSQGPLHDVLTAALPDMVGPGNVCDLHKLADRLGITQQAIYKWMRPNYPNRIPFKQARAIVQMSQNQTLSRLTAGERHRWHPATEKDFFDFVT